MTETCDLKVIINDHHTFFLNKSILFPFSPKLKQLAKQEQEQEIKLKDFPGGPIGFELVSRFCYNNGRVQATPSTICLLHSSASALSIPSLIDQSEAFLDGLFYWTWEDILTSLTTCPPSSPLLNKLIPSLLSKIQSEHATSASSSPDTPTTSDSLRHSYTKDWWFDDLTALPPIIIQKILITVNAFGPKNKNLTLTRFLLHYLKRATKRRWKECNALADTAVYGVVLVGRATFSCRGLFWVTRVVSRFGISRECRQVLENVIGMTLDRATLDDLLVSGRDGEVYDVNLVVRLVRVFVVGVDEEGGVGAGVRMKKVGRLVDKYLREISPDQGLKVSRFLAVAESLPDSARGCYDGVYRALDIYLEV